MARLTISPSAARRHANAWRIAAVALAVGAGALWAIQTPLGSDTVALDPAPAPNGPEPIRPAPAPLVLATLDAETARGVQDRLDHAYDRPPRPEGDPAPATPVAAVAAWRYLGMIRTSKHKSALVSVDARQHVVREGASLKYADSSGAEATVTLVEVRPDAIVIDEGSGLREIKREMRTGPAVAWVTPGMNLTPEQMDQRAQQEQARLMRAASMPGSTPGVVDHQALLRDRGVTQAQAKQARDRLEQLRGRARARAGTAVAPDGTTTTDNTANNAADDTPPEAPERNR